jgi:hypothetical protein
MRRFTLIATGVVAAFYLATSPAQAHYNYCGQPYWYPQSWTVMTRHHCLPEYSAIYYHPVARPHYRHRHVQSHRLVRVADYRRTYIASRRPYLRPGWWW